MSCSFSSPLHLLLITTVIIISFLHITPVFPTNQSHAAKTPHPITPSNNMDPHELQTLFTIMETLSSSANWRASYPNPCSSTWPGIQCRYTPLDGRFHVIRLDFGTPPNPTCKNSPTFPSEIFHLQHLESIFIFNCFTHSPTTILFPTNRPLITSSSSSSSSLQQLSLRSNPALVGTIPPQISSLKSLQILTLSQNKLTGKIPFEIFGLSSLIHLDLSYNELTGSIPMQLGNLRNLVGLDLSYNKLTGPIPSAIGGLGALQKLDLSSNSITGSIPATVRQLKSLVFLALSSNRLISGGFPGGMKTEELENLQYFLMDDNPMFAPLPEEIGRLRRLQELRLSNSGYSGEIPPGYSQLANLSSMSLQNNRLSGEIPAGFTNLSRIYHLNLSRNFLDGVVPFGTGFLRRLGRNLDLSGNPGLCLSKTAAFGVADGVGVGVCDEKGSVMKPLKKSEAPLVCSCRVFIFDVALVLVTLLLHYSLCYG